MDCDSVFFLSAVGTFANRLWFRFLFLFWSCLPHDAHSFFLVSLISMRVDAYFFLLPAVTIPRLPCLRVSLSFEPWSLSLFFSPGCLYLIVYSHGRVNGKHIFFSLFLWKFLAFALGNLIWSELIGSCPRNRPFDHQISSALLLFFFLFIFSLILPFFRRFAPKKMLLHHIFRIFLLILLTVSLHIFRYFTL